MPLPRPAPGTTRWWVIGVLGCVSAVVVIVWWGIVSTTGSVRPEVTGYSVESDSEVLVKYDLHRPEGVAVLCRVRLDVHDAGNGVLRLCVFVVRNALD
jgi:hypothetical protein